MRSNHSIKFLLLFVISLFAQGQLHIEYSGNTYFTKEMLDGAAGTGIIPRGTEEEVVRASINRILDFYSDKGFPLAKVKIDSLINEEGINSLYLNIEAGDYVRYGLIAFTGNKISRRDALLRQAGLQLKTQFDEEKVNEASELLYSTELFRRKPHFEIYRDGTEYGINFILEEKKYMQMTLMGGYSSGDKGDNISGMAGLSSDNIMGTFRKASVYWERNGSNSEKIKVEYKEPFFFSYRVSSGLMFDQEYKKNNFLSRQFGLDEMFTVSSAASVNAGYKRKYLYPDSLYLGSDNDITIVRYSGGIRFFRGSVTDAIPSSGGYVISAGIASLEIDFKDSSVIHGTELDFNTSYIKRTGRNYFMKISLSYDQIMGKSDLPEFGKIYFGGAGSLRGYREDFFVSDIFLLQSAEFYYVPDSQDLAFSIFFDNGIFNKNRRNIEKISGLSGEQSYGGGLSVMFGSGEVAIIAGIPARYGISEGMIHIRYSVRF